jgi:hypothetical protein
MVGTVLIPSIVPALFITAILGCSTVDAPESIGDDAIEESGAAAQLEDSLTGVWKGLSACGSGRWGFACRGVRRISFTILPLSASRTKGAYACGAGTVSCRNRLETGRVARIDINGRRLWLRVMLGDGSSCLFTSRLANARLGGGYECLQGAALVEQGSWWAERSY